MRRRIGRTYERTAHHLRVLGIRDGDGREQTIRVTDEHPFFVAGRGWTKARDLSAGDRLAGAGCEASTVTSNLGEDHPEGVTVYNLEVEDDHTYFVRAEGSDGEPVWVHNASYPGANPAVTETGMAHARRAEAWWSTLSRRARTKATVAVSRAGEQEVVSLYGNIGKGISAEEVAAFRQSVRDAGGVPIFTSGDVHAEVALHRAFPDVDAIGVSNPKGPCDDFCGPYFTEADYYNVFWHSWSER